MHDLSTEPIRAEILGVERLEQHARNLAAEQRVTRGMHPGRPLLPRVAANAAALRKANAAIITALHEKAWITPAAEWLIDNFFVVEDQLREIRHDLPEGFYRQLSKLATGPLAGYPRVYGIAWSFIAHTDSYFDSETLRRFISAYQQEQPLTIGELWAIPITLRVTYVENLRRMADVMVQERVLRNQADEIAEQVLAEDGRVVPSLSAMLEQDRDAAVPSAFAVELVQRFRDQDPAVTPALQLLHEHLAAHGTTPDAIVLGAHQQHAAMTVTVRNIITSMRVVSALDWTVFFESVSLVDEALRAGSDFAAMDFVSRDRYRNAIEKLARRAKRRELEVTRAALARAAAAREELSAAGADGDARRTDPGFYLLGDGRREFERLVGFRPGLQLRFLRAFLDLAKPGFFTTLLVLTASILAVPLIVSAHAGFSPGGRIALGLLALIPASDLAIALLNRWVTMIVKPGLLPRMEWRGGIPQECRTLLAVPTIFTDAADVEDQIEKLEVHYLANADGDIRFALISDWTDAPNEHMPGDEEILVAARSGIARLNALHGPAPDGGARFFVFHRRRRWNAGEGVWMGWERKRGKLHELNALLRGANETTFLLSPEEMAAVPGGVRYVVTLDSDTRLAGGSVARLVGTMMHPLNKPRFDAATRRIVEGYGVLQPRVTPPLPRRTSSILQRLSSGVAGIDPYASAVSDVYQDLFDEGSYVGKGVYDVDAFEASLAGRVPENSLLSHDLLEGLFARAGLVTDIEFFETAPGDYLTAASRRHRWTRGDWQLLPWIMNEQFSAIARWKMIDNLRRSLSLPAAFLTLLAGWVWPGSQPLLWTAFVVMVILLPLLLPALAGIRPHVPGASKRRHVRAILADFWSAMAQTGLAITMMTHQAWLMGDAILRTLTRICVTHRHLLQWKTTASVASVATLSLPGFYRGMMGGIVLALLGAVVVAIVQPGVWPVAVSFFALWGLSPLVALRISTPGHETREKALTRSEKRALRLIARRTWRFFEKFVTAESLALPPDNFQETPEPVVAERTSPTNIGLYLLSSVSARDFGWIGTLDLVERLEATLRTVKKLEHHRGHLYNWYDTRDGHPLEPRYVSSVDSGNLAGALLALSSACEEIVEQALPLPMGLTGVEDAALLLRRAAHDSVTSRGASVIECRGLDQALDVLMGMAAKVPATPAQWAVRLQELEYAAHSAAGFAHDVIEDPEMPREPVLDAIDALHATIKAHARDLDTLMPWLRLPVGGQSESATARLATPMSLAELPRHCQASLHDLVARRAAAADAAEPTTHLREIDALVMSLKDSAGAATALVQRFARIANDARQMVTDMEFGLLFDPNRMLFSIGYRMNDGSLDPGRYDLLASEARVLSFIAIAKGDVPLKHWFRLGRPLVLAGNDAVLLSWSGSMFEYLMPRLIMRAPADGILDQTCRMVVGRQIAYGRKRGVPWGVSESGYNARDLSMTYQYSNFGVPGLGLRRGLADDVVVAPYATGLAAMLDPAAALRNFRALEEAGASGPYGFYESIDYTPSRLPTDVLRAVVQMYMSHHQGMLLVAVGNVLHGGAMRNRFHNEPIVRASELLLEERTPRDVAVVRPHLHPATLLRDVRELVPPQTRRFDTPHGAMPRTLLLSNGHYSVMLTAAGAGYSRCGDTAITRWREDPTRDNAGFHIFLRDVASGERWSAGFQPTQTEPKSYNVTFSEDRAEFVRSGGTIDTRLEVIVSSEDDAEVRRVAISNHGLRTREIEVTSYAEVVLAPQAADANHPAFSNLFVQTECVPERNTLLATRRPRSRDEAQVWLAHVLAVGRGSVGELEWETDRARFLGRGRGVHAPLAETGGKPLSGTTGPVLDPIVSLRRRVRVRSGETVWLMFSNVVGSSRGGVLDLADKYNDVTTFDRAATMAWTQAMVQLHYLGVSPDEAHLFQSLSGVVLYADRSLRASNEVMVRQSEGVAALWAHGISGDDPIVLVQIDDAEDIGIVRQLLRAHGYWRLKGLAVDLVILNDRPPSYLQDLQTSLENIVGASRTIASQQDQESRGKVFILRADQVTPGQRDALESAARASFSSRNGVLAAQVERAVRLDATAAAPPGRIPAAPAPEPEPRALPSALEFFNGLGGFGADGREYHIRLRAGQWTPAPWINVITNPRFGCLVSEAGAGCTWSINSQTNRLTAWCNDPVADPPAEMFYIRDDDSGVLWSPTPLPIREDTGSYEVYHGRGWTRFVRDAHGISLELLQFVPAEDPIKVSRLTITNHSSGTRRLTVTAYLEWVLGETRAVSAPFVITEMDPNTNAMFARNPWNPDFGTRIAFADLGGAQGSWTANRTEFLGRNGAPDSPAALRRREPLSGRVGAGLDPCGALQTTIEIAAGERSEVVLFLGQAETREEAGALIRRYRSTDLSEHRRLASQQWDRMLGTVQVKTPERALDLMLNDWLVYQTLASRLWARTAFYQSSGAYGFRDQLQDVMALMVSRNDLAREQILRSAARQFVEGDVQHWWHEPSGRGIRTRISDDLLWLPYVAGHYQEVTGDTAILDEVTPFLDGPTLADGQQDAFFAARVSEQRGTLFEHCARAIDRSLAVGVHGLPLMGAGDWNDGMNRVGVEGKGESVWLAWFLCSVLATWVPLAEARGENERAKAWKNAAGALKDALEREAWDGAWYRRAYFDDGTPLGSAGADACAIDSIAQSWAVMSAAADPERARRAMASVYERLVRRDDGLILLLTPPFGDTTLEPGYIKGYVPGVRENGGQYTHAATWVAIAFALLGDGDTVAELLAMLNPISHGDTPAKVARYKVEPYVLAGDVYSEEPHAGRGGWTWYSGSAGWWYRAAMEWMLGFRLRGARLELEPCIPRNWPGFTITFRYHSARYDIVVENGGAGRGIATLELDGVALVDHTAIPLADDQRTHRVRAVLAKQ